MSSELQQLFVDYKALVKALDSDTPVPAAKSTIATRKKELKKPLDSQNPEAIAELDELMSSFVLKKIDRETPRGEVELSTQQLVDLAKQKLETDKVREALDADNEVTKDSFFNHLNAVYRKKGVASPEKINDSVEVPELGVTLARQAADNTAPSLDQTKIKSLLTPEQYAQVFKKRIIPAVEVEELDEDALVHLAGRDPAVYEALKKSLVKGKERGGSFYLRPTPKK